MLTGLTVLGDTGLELTSTSSNDENGTVSLGGTGDHVFDEVTVTRGINNLCRSNAWPTRKKVLISIHTVTMYLGVSNFQRAISIVIPRSRSALSLSSTQAISVVSVAR